MKKEAKILVGIGIVIPIIVGLWIVFQAEQNLPTSNQMTIGIASWVSNTDFDENITGFKNGLKTNGYIEGENVEYITKNSMADKEKQREIIQGFIDQKVDLIYSLTTSGTLIAKEMTQDIPIVFSIVTYPVEAGIIESLESSGNNLVGTRNYIPIDQQLDFFVQLYPIEKLGFLHRDGEPNSVIQYNEMKEYASSLGIEVLEIAPSSLEDTEQKILSVIDNVDAIYHSCDTLVQSGAEKISIDIAKIKTKPTFSCNKEGVKEGSLLGLVTEFERIGYSSGLKASYILDGVINPTELETSGPNESYSIINQNTLQEFEIELPDDFKKKVREFVNP